MGMKNALCCFLLLVLVFGACSHLLFIAFCCSSLLFLVFEIESILSQKPKQANAFCCSFCFLWMFPFEHRIARCGFLLVAKTKTSNKRQKKPKWKPGLSQKQERVLITPRVFLSSNFREMNHLLRYAHFLDRGSDNSTVVRSVQTYISFKPKVFVSSNFRKINHLRS